MLHGKVLRISMANGMIILLLLIRALVRMKQSDVWKRTLKVQRTGEKTKNKNLKLNVSGNHSITL